MVSSSAERKQNFVRSLTKSGLRSLRLSVSCWTVNLIGGFEPVGIRCIICSSTFIVRLQTAFPIVGLRRSPQDQTAIHTMRLCS
jgi:hypothetical protein